MAEVDPLYSPTTDVEPLLQLFQDFFSIMSLSHFFIVIFKNSKFFLFDNCFLILCALLFHFCGLSLLIGSNNVTPSALKMSVTLITLYPMIKSVQKNNGDKEKKDAEGELSAG